MSVYYSLVRWLEELKKESTTLTETIKKVEEEIAKVTGVKPQNNTAKNVAIEAVALKPFKHYNNE